MNILPACKQYTDAKMTYIHTYTHTYTHTHTYTTALNYRCWFYGQNSLNWTQNQFLLSKFAMPSISHLSLSVYFDLEFGVHLGPRTIKYCTWDINRLSVADSSSPCVCGTSTFDPSSSLSRSAHACSAARENGITYHWRWTRCLCQAIDPVCWQMVMLSKLQLSLRNRITLLWHGTLRPLYVIIFVCSH